MLSNSPSLARTSGAGFDNDPFLSYSQALHDYTLKLWTESRRIAEEKARGRAARKEEVSRRWRETEPQLPRPSHA
ncbi:hypothetical protein HYDPIDRAFT_110958 [Hydnomerulius pinastri MD-312]|uniref:Uncharacterized protein n=1 Tax=Hydnomerulius pinastri MD-312 TaxID=994086 RepID=A0A0C9WGA0_9AGAM|nr:hypothetical protein HYDPIDRAFT_110958 [Hydnomerulius pinastri MD-312]